MLEHCICVAIAYNNITLLRAGVNSICLLHVFFIVVQRDQSCLFKYPNEAIYMEKAQHSDIYLQLHKASKIFHEAIQ